MTGNSNGVKNQLVLPKVASTVPAVVVVVIVVAIEVIIIGVTGTYGNNKPALL